MKEPAQFKKPRRKDKQEDEDMDNALMSALQGGDMFDDEDSDGEGDFMIKPARQSLG